MTNATMIEHLFTREETADFFRSKPTHGTQFWFEFRGEAPVIGKDGAMVTGFGVSMELPRKDAVGISEVLLSDMAEKLGGRIRVWYYGLSPHIIRFGN